MAKRRKKLTKKKENGHIFRIIIFVITLLLLFIVFQQRNYIHRFSRLGYLGILFVNFVASATVFMPLPGLASVFLGGAIWNPVLIGLYSGIGAMFGEVLGYFLGYGSRGFLRSFEKKNHWIFRLERIFQRAGFIAIFIFALVPLPIFDIIGIMAGVTNYPVWKFALATLFGRILRNFIIAWSGAKILL